MIPPVVPGQIADENQIMVGWKNTFNMRQISLMNLAASQLNCKNGTKSMIPNYRRAYSITNPAKSLDLLRKNLQNAINRDIDNVIKKYLDKFFQPAINNIKNNLGRDSVGEDHIKEVCRQMLEEAKVMYKVSANSRDSSPYDFSDSEASLTDGKFGRNSPSCKRKESDDTDSEKNICVYKKHKSKLSTDYQTIKLPSKQETSKWDPDRIRGNTLFIMGARANKVLGYGQTRGRLYVRHPNLLRYSGDQEDKEWLTSKNLMPPSGGKAYLMLLEDIKELTESEDYKGNPNLQLNELKGFEVPQFLLLKIKAFIEYVRSHQLDGKRGLGIDAEMRSQSATPPNICLVDSSPSTPSDTIQLVDNSTDLRNDEFVNISDLSSNLNQSLMSSLLGSQSASDNSVDF